MISSFEHAVWPLAAILITLIVVQKAYSDLRAIALWLAPAFSTSARKHAMFLAIIVGFGLQAFGTGFYDNFWPIEPSDMAKLGWWQVLAAVLKSCSFAIGIMVGYALKGPQDAVKADAPKPTEPPKPVSEIPPPNA